MGENRIYEAVEKYLNECVNDEMSQEMPKSQQEYHLKINVYMLKRVVQIILSEMAKDEIAKEPATPSPSDEPPCTKYCEWREGKPMHSNYGGFCKKYNQICSVHLRDKKASEPSDEIEKVDQYHCVNYRNGYCQRYQCECIDKEDKSECGLKPKQVKELEKI